MLRTVVSTAVGIQAAAAAAEAADQPRTTSCGRRRLCLGEALAPHGTDQGGAHLGRAVAHNHAGLHNKEDEDKQLLKTAWSKRPTDAVQTAGVIDLKTLKS